MKSYNEVWEKVLNLVENAHFGSEYVFRTRSTTVINVLGVGRITEHTQGRETAEKVLRIAKQKELTFTFHLTGGFSMNRTLDTLGWARVVTEEQADEIDLDV